MNSKINYSGYVEMFLNSSDDFEPYGLVPAPYYANQVSASNANYEQHREYLFADPLEE